jgi:hypothetical protein
VQDGAAARRLAVVKVRAVAPRLPIGAIVDDVEYSHGAAVIGTAGVAAWIDGPVAADAALLWWARHSPGVPLHLVGAPLLGRVARRLTGLDVVAWEVSGGDVRRAVPDAPLPRAPIPAAHDVFVATIERCGAEPVREHGVLSGEVLGLEVCRIVGDDDPRLDVGVGAIDRETYGLVHAGRAPEESLREVVATVRALRGGGDGGHPFARLAAARLLRWCVLNDPSVVGAASLSPAEPPHPRGGLTIDEPCVATGTATDGSPMVVVCAASADPRAVPFAIDARLRESPGARVVVAVREGNVTATMSALAAMVRPAVAFIEVSRTA